jgi:hypothetical protein
MKHSRSALFLLTGALVSLLGVNISTAQMVNKPMVPSSQELNRPFGKHDEVAFLAPPKIYHPETWFHFIGGNVSKEGITKDLEAVAKAGFSGIHLFHGQFGGAWPGVDPQITCLSPSWDDAVKFTAMECKRLGLTFFMNNTPGWATAGGPWIKPENAMRNLIWSRTDIKGGRKLTQNLALPEPNKEEWRDYKDVTVLAFPTPAGDTGKPLEPQTIKSDTGINWKPYFQGRVKDAVHLLPSSAGKPHWIEVSFPKDVLLRCVEFSSIQEFNHSWNYEPGVKVSIQAISANGQVKDILNVNMPQSNWQDDQPITLACSEVAGVKKYRISIQNNHNMSLSSLRLFSAARKNSWESEAAWTLRSILRTGQNPKQSAAAFIDPTKILDLSKNMDKNGNLSWQAPQGNWTILRFGHVNAGKENGPAPKEGTGWEANKLSKSGADAHFAGYIGRLSGKNGPVSDGLLNGMLIDSWECHPQSWTEDMESEFKRVSHYSAHLWLPALLGYVVKDHATTGKFLTDWRRTVSDLYTNNFYGEMSAQAHKNGLNVTYETACGDVIPGDILEYFKFADVPMTEFWQPMTPSFVGSLNFKPIKPTTSAARMYGKPRVAAESFTSMNLTWDEHFEMLRDVANVNAQQGVSHFVFHTYTLNPQKPFLPPGTSFGAGIGTPFLRGQTWWKYMPEFTNYLARCSYLLERGKPVSDVLWYLGDEINHKPDQNFAFPEGFKYDYCNPDVLVNRLQVKNGLLVTPEGISYRALWLQDAPNMLTGTLEKIYALVHDGATVIGNAPTGLATLSGGTVAKRRFATMVIKIWGNKTAGVHKVGKGRVISGTTLTKALNDLKLKPDVIGGDALWTHRQIEGADLYFLSAPKDKDFNGDLSFRTNGLVELWDPVNGEVKSVSTRRVGGRTVVKLDLLKSNSCFLVFKSNKDLALKKVSDPQIIVTQHVAGPWMLSFPTGWGAPEAMQVNELKPWKDLEISAEGKAFSGTATYTTTFNVDNLSADGRYVLDLGKVDMIASVYINDQKIGNVIAPPYKFNLKKVLKPGQNSLKVEVTSTWFNRLVYDAGQKESERKTWVISGPEQNVALRTSGLMGPVVIQKVTNK